MITPAIERALIRGEARLLTHMHASSAVSKIEIPPNTFAIVLDVTVWPFTDSAVDLIGRTAAELDQRSTHVIELTNQDQGRTGFIYRNWVNQPADFYGFTYPTNMPPHTFHTYLIRSKTFYVQIGTYEGTNAPKDLNDAPLNATTQDPPNPKGYGSNTNVINNIQNTDLDWYQPAGNDGQFSLNSLAPGQDLYYQPFPDYKNGNLSSGRLRYPNTKNFLNAQTPLAQITYVIVNEQVRKNFQ